MCNLNKQIIIERLIDNMPGGFFVYKADEGGELLYVNDAVLAMYGCDNLDEFKALTGFRFQGMVHPDDYQKVKDSISKQVSESERHMDYVEYRIIRKDGTERWVDDYGSMAYTEECGNVFYVFINDNTERHLILEEALERERRASAAKSTFLFNISHDIRTPMNSIMGFTELAKRHVNDPEQLSMYLDKVDISNRHMLSLIDDLLEMSQIDSGQTRIKTEVVSLSKELADVVEIMETQAHEKGVTLETDSKLPEEDVYVDSIRFRRIMMNLISNAIKFTNAGGWVRVSARPKNVSKSGYTRYILSVKDNGIGMSEDFLQRVFEAFEREETSTQTGYIGTGLGLSITKRLLDIMGGSIEVKSRKGEGSEFIVSLPLKLAVGGDSVPAEAENSHMRQASAKTETAPAAKKRILLVEDIEINRMLAEHILQEGGFLVESVPDGCDAVEAFKNKPEGYYDLVLMDIQMPVMNGYEATRVIRALGRFDTDKVPIIALSANAREEDKRMSTESGMNDHVAKPFDVDKLIQTINEHLAAAG